MENVLIISADDVRGKLENYAARSADSVLSSFSKLLANYLSGDITPEKFAAVYEEAVMECETAPVVGLVDDEIVGRPAPVYRYIRENIISIGEYIFPVAFLTSLTSVIEKLSFLDYFSPIL